MLISAKYHTCISQNGVQLNVSIMSKLCIVKVFGDV